jgi:hypothetical protein
MIVAECSGFSKGGLPLIPVALAHFDRAVPVEHLVELSEVRAPVVVGIEELRLECLDGTLPS